jgi:hypothetical protein
MLTALVSDRDAVPAERSLDIRFDEFMADDLGTATEVLRLAGEEVTAEVRSALEDYLEGHRRGRLGTVAYDPAAVGLDPDELRERFAPYVARFLS